MKLAIEHTTHFEFEEITRHSVQYLRLTPFDSGRQKVLNWSLSLPTDANEITDGYGNVMHVFTIDDNSVATTARTSATGRKSAQSGGWRNNNN